MSSDRLDFYGFISGRARDASAKCGVRSLSLVARKDLALRGYVDPIRADADPPVKRVYDQFIEKGGRFFVCPICFNERALDEAELVENAELKGATPLMEFAGEGAMTFTY